MVATNYTKLKTNLRVSIQRLKLMEKKKTENAQKARREIAAYIANNKNERAKIRVESIIREDYLVEALEIVEMYCDLLLTRFGLIEQMKTLDEGLAEAISSIIWVAPRIEGCTELKIVADLLTQKYGKQYAMAVREGAIKTVGENLKKKMSIEGLPKLMIERYMIEIARDQNVTYEPDPEVMKHDEVAMAEEAIANRRPGFLIDFDTGGLGPPPLPMHNPSAPYNGPAVGFQYGFSEPNPNEKKDEKGASAGDFGSYGPPPSGYAGYAVAPQQPGVYPGNPGPHEMPYYDPPNYHSICPPSAGNSSQDNNPPPPAPRKSKMTPNDADDFVLPDLPDVPGTLPDIEKEPKHGPSNEDNIDFDDLAKRFEALKKKK